MAGKVAYVQDAEDDAGSALEGAERTYARSVAPSSPQKHTANVARPRPKEKKMRRTSIQDPGLTDSDDTVNDPTTAKYERQRHERVNERSGEERRRRKKDEQRPVDRREQERPKKPAVRPPVKSVKTAPVVHTQQPDEYRRPRFEDDSSQYGIQPAQGHRPRGMSNRPNSYYGQGTRPPPANERWYAQNAPSPYAPSPMAPSPMQPLPPMPQQSPFTPGMPYAHPQEWAQPGGMPYPAPPSSASDYFPPPHHAPPPHHTGPPQPAPGQTHLAQRFQRPSSAMGHRSISDSYEHDPYEKEQMPRRRSVKIRPAEGDPRQPRDDPRQLMPPPPRPKTSQPTRQAVKGPPRQKPAPKMPPPRQIAHTSYDSDAFDDEDSLYQQVVHYEYDDGVVDRPRAHRRRSSAYSREGYSIEPAGRTRRHSYMAAADSYPEPKVGSYSEHKMAEAQHAAMAYQNGVSGGPTAPLTAAALKAKQSKSSRSSGSSESRDDSEYRQSATTRTTRSSAIESEDVTIKVTGSAVLKIGGAEIQCQDGGEINITQPSRNGGSDRASTVYSDDRPSRRDSRPLPIRARADSWNRSQVSDYSYAPQARPPFF
ncbi:hypothetical protein CCHR01_11915 [Colletotrichum chrysophilum]|uniref:Uncharacterized protein n=3 Tax=Colletotrichum gloeosporioides species complex TaxID=2707338 RepID=A0AAD9AF47_9PEZI|nr:hypothetical protein CCHR01_11915 [Colletotrichum chrysophilum]